MGHFKLVEPTQFDFFFLSLSSLHHLFLSCVVCSFYPLPKIQTRGESLRLNQVKPGVFSLSLRVRGKSVSEPLMSGERKKREDPVASFLFTSVLHSLRPTLKRRVRAKRQSFWREMMRMMGMMMR